MPSLHKGHANLLCIIPILLDVSEDTLLSAHDNAYVVVMQWMHYEYGRKEKGKDMCIHLSIASGVVKVRNFALDNVDSKKKAKYT